MTRKIRITKTCLCCGNALSENSRKDTKFCSEACKKKNKRKTAKIANAAASQRFPNLPQKIVIKAGFCACEGCDNRARTRSKFCSNTCKQKEYRLKNPDKIKQYEKKRSQPVHDLAALFSQTYHNFDDYYQVSEFFTRLLNIAIKNDTSKNYGFDLKVLRRLLDKISISDSNNNIKYISVFARELLKFCTVTYGKSLCELLQMDKLPMTLAVASNEPAQVIDMKKAKVQLTIKKVEKIKARREQAKKFDKEFGTGTAPVITRNNESGFKFDD